MDEVPLGRYRLIESFERTGNEHALTWAAVIRTSLLERLRELRPCGARQ